MHVPMALLFVERAAQCSEGTGQQSSTENQSSQGGGNIPSQGEVGLCPFSARVCYFSHGGHGDERGCL